jgi:hypothetical protein
MHSKNLIAKLERELMPIFGVLGNVDGGDAYLNAVEMMEFTLQNLATLPVEYWALVSQGILDIKRQIDEKNQEGDNGVPDGETNGVESDSGQPSASVDDEQEHTPAQEHETGGH